MDGDARGGAALSVVGVVGVPIAFVGSGERLQDLEPFHPDRVVSRVLGMGDVLSLIEKAEEAVSHGRRREARSARSGKNEFTLEDFRDQLRTIKKMGPLEQILGMLPGMGNLKELAANREQVDDKQLGRVEAIINSMTREGAPQPSADQRQPPQAHRQGQRHVGRGGEPAAEAVRADAEDAEAARRHGRPRRQEEDARPRDDEGDDEVSSCQQPVTSSEKTTGNWKLETETWQLTGEEMLAIRLRRTGSKKRPFFRVVVTDSRTARDSRFVEVLGHYNPRTKPETLKLERERLEHWLKAGAQPSDTVRTLVARMPPAPADDRPPR